MFTQAVVKEVETGVVHMPGSLCAGLAVASVNLQCPHQRVQPGCPLKEAAKLLAKGNCSETNPHTPPEVLFLLLHVLGYLIPPAA